MFGTPSRGHNSIGSHPADVVKTVQQPLGADRRPNPPFTISPFTLLLGLVGVIIVFTVLYLLVGS